MFLLNWSAQPSNGAFVRDALIPPLIYAATYINGQFCRCQAAPSFSPMQQHSRCVRAQYDFDTSGVGSERS